MADAAERWARERAPELLARAEAEAAAVLRDVLVRTALAQAGGDAGHEKQHRRPPAPERADAGRAPQAKGPAGDALWAYCVLRAEETGVNDLTGVRGGAVTRVQHGALAALVSPVPLAEFDAEPLRANLNDLEWLEDVARAHEAVLDTVLGRASLVPLRLCTIFAGEEGVRSMLQREEAPLADALDRLDGRQEWGVKLLVDRGKLEREARRQSPDGPRLEQELEGMSAGGAYMAGRRLERQVRATADDLATKLTTAVHARLAAHADDAVTLPAQNRELSGHSGDMLLNGAYLVSVDEADDFAKLVAALEEDHQDVGAQLALTGPWPPYNFVGAAAGAVA